MDTSTNAKELSPKEVMSILPQGKGSKLDSDTVDGYQVSPASNPSPNTIVTLDDEGKLPSTVIPSGVANAYILIKDVKSSGTAGGTFTSGAWQTHDLNTEEVDTGNNASVASNQITLAAGTYRFRGVNQGYLCAMHQNRLYNVTDAAVLGLGVQVTANTVDVSGMLAECVGRFTIASSKVIELQARCSSTKSGDGYGPAHSWGSEVYAQVEFWKEA